MKFAYFILFFLYPNAKILDQMTNRRLVEYLQEWGDPLSSSRPVDHWLDFDTKVARQQFINQAQQVEFAVEGLAEKEEAVRPYQLQISKPQAVTLAAIDETTVQLRRLWRISPSYNLYGNF